jgi:hypothetical protein
MTLGRAESSESENLCRVYWESIDICRASCGDLGSVVLISERSDLVDSKQDGEHCTMGLLYL